LTAPCCRRLEEKEVRNRVRAAIASLPARERRVVALYYYGEATMKQIGAEIGVNESRVSQLHARAIQRLRRAFSPDASAQEVAQALRPAILAFEQTVRRMRLARSHGNRQAAVVLPYKRPAAQVMRPRPRPEESRLAAGA
jgi:DNA-binding CsgD family transcriptional regulator